MTRSQEKSPVEAATSTEPKQVHLPNGCSDNQPTASTATKRRRPGQRGYFHTPVYIDDPEFIHTLCGERFPRRTATYAKDAPNDPRPFCPACANLQGLQRDLDATRQRAEEIHQAMITLALYLKEVG